MAILTRRSAIGFIQLWKPHTRTHLESSKMKRLLVHSVLLLSLLAGNHAFSADFQKGLYACKTGNYAKAFREFTSLAEQGDIRAQVNLGVMYENGQGTIKDYVHAYMWWNLAASQGNKTAEKFKNIIEKKLSPTDISTAKQLARECVEKGYKNC